ncbi:transglutaminase domain-containing protein [Psychroserpens sp. XS_ASV72]|uniref:transglutaminase domain-containing protein n=1 Tax=Psychroserpens sp. XS_ASV72 TaxID=3241293 RepID=UPI0035169450
MKSFRCLVILLLVVHFGYSQVSDFDHIDFSKADNIAKIHEGENLKNLPDLVHKLTSNLDTDVERFRAIYIWVCQNVSNDYRLYLKNKRKREKYKDDSLELKDWNDKFKGRLFNKLRKRKRTICSGYSYIISELSKLANIDCRMINGFGRTSTTAIDDYSSTNHSWNAVKLNGKWYLCDATWASGIIHPKNYGFKFDYNNGLFFTEPEFFAVTHFPVDTKWMLLEADKKPSFPDFINNPILYGSAFKTLESLITPKQMHHEISRNGILNFKYKLKQAIDPKTLQLKIYNGFNTETVKPSQVNLDNSILSFQYKFESKGFFDVHVSINDKFIATYTVKVSK